MKCKNCGEKDAEMYSKYTSGEFCSRECARAFSTKIGRKDISKKVSKTLNGSGHGDVTKTCPTCGNDFTMIYKRRYRTYCSTKCANSDPNVRDKISKSHLAIKAGKPVMTPSEVKNNNVADRKRKREQWDKENSNGKD